MTPRERDPMVWAAAYALARQADYQAAYSAADGPHEQRHAQATTLADVSVRDHEAQADAAVMALHPDNTYATPSGSLWRVR